RPLPSAVGGDALGLLLLRAHGLHRFFRPQGGVSFILRSRRMAGGSDTVSWAGLMPPILAGLLVVLISAAVWARLLFRMQQADFWEFQIRAFEEADRLHPPGEAAILFTGSSRIRLWRTLERDMAPLRVLNRGFGGCHLAHVNHYLKRVVLPYRPRAVVLYAGENDLGWLSGKTPGTVLEDLKRFVATVQEKCPGTRV